jgi:hypothetical protein
MGHWGNRWSIVLLLWRRSIFLSLGRSIVLTAWRWVSVGRRSRRRVELLLLTLLRVGGVTWVVLWRWVRVGVVALRRGVAAWGSISVLWISLRRHIAVLLLLLLVLLLLLLVLLPWIHLGFPFACGDASKDGG